MAGFHPKHFAIPQSPLYAHRSLVLMNQTHEPTGQLGVRLIHTSKALGWREAEESGAETERDLGRSSLPPPLPSSNAAVLISTIFSLEKWVSFPALNSPLCCSSSQLTGSGPLQCLVCPPPPSWEP